MKLRKLKKEKALCQLQESIELLISLGYGSTAITARTGQSVMTSIQITQLMQKRQHQQKQEQNELTFDYQLKSLNLPSSSLNHENIYQSIENANANLLNPITTSASIVQNIATEDAVIVSSNNCNDPQQSPEVPEVS
eukprot:CAMPEP_0114336528 /NCGR_PEP_ID=MMETSP0101-20121206/5768_1 /TAXON_ID=38822 ORGANISM="Pteridomonas danica, Strain PT" /NCGR_SAMPLE_ID=MMETSP0101 /ASSEMBLY_ACC=CAM_ASM_000211 /LENGTH=136 /DNA_ID=CAMNT_0001468483 /DNA_START=74 /DNA_END=484 /DNA_ORIENTATION=+